MEEKGSPSEGSEITAVVISVADNIERVFFHLLLFGKDLL